MNLSGLHCGSRLEAEVEMERCHLWGIVRLKRWHWVVWAAMVALETIEWISDVLWGWVVECGDDWGGRGLGSSNLKAYLWDTKLRHFPNLGYLYTWGRAQETLCLQVVLSILTWQIWFSRRQCRRLCWTCRSMMSPGSCQRWTCVLQIHTCLGTPVALFWLVRLWSRFQVGILMDLGKLWSQKKCGLLQCHCAGLPQVLFALSTWTRRKRSVQKFLVLINWSDGIALLLGKGTITKS